MKGKVTFLAILSAIFFSQIVSAQQVETRLCGAELLKRHLEAKVPDAKAMLLQTLQEKVTAGEAYLTSASKSTAAANPIPVVFHIVLNQAQINKLGGAAGIQQRIDSQIAVINRDFNAQNGDASQIPAAFKSFLGNANIQFALARRMPDGTGTPGYDITTITSTGINESSSTGSGMGFAEAKYVNGVANAWDPATYLNIWIINPLDNGSTSSILGLTIPPSYKRYGVSGNEMGIVLNYGAFGSRAAVSQYYISGINGGRTLTHELGHFFEIWHVWGDDNGACPGSGGQDDGISDTPPQSDATYGCPSFPRLDSCTSTGNGIMFMNYMDYVNDACMHLFTIKQAAVMHASIVSGGESYTLTQHPEVLQFPTDVATISAAATSVNIYPNPATSTVNISLGNTDNIAGIDITDLTGRTVNQIAVSTGVLNYSLDVSGYVKGIYIVNCHGSNGQRIIKKLQVQ